MAKPETYVVNDFFKYAGDEAMRAGGDDPRLAAQQAERMHRQSQFGHVETVANPTRVNADADSAKQYSLR